MNAANRQPVNAASRLICGTLTAGLILGMSHTWAAAAPARSEPHSGSHSGSHSGPRSAGEHRRVDFGPLGVLWPGELIHFYGGRPYGSPGSWTRPVSDPDVSETYGASGGWAAGHHTGVDFAVPTGTPVRSVGDGTVVFSGDSGAYGELIVVRMKDGTYTLFAHLSERNAHKGDRVRAGSSLGKSGNTGNTTGPHLHFETRVERDYGSDTDPMSYLAQRGVHF